LHLESDSSLNSLMNYKSGEQPPGLFECPVAQRGATARRLSLIAFDVGDHTIAAIIAS
jgi:hypothetical protein